jgi:hypothetical protein
MRLMVAAGTDLQHGVSRSISAGLVAPSAAMLASVCEFTTINHTVAYRVAVFFHAGPLAPLAIVWSTVAESKKALKGF